MYILVFLCNIHIFALLFLLTYKRKIKLKIEIVIQFGVQSKWNIKKNITQLSYL